MKRSDEWIHSIIGSANGETLIAYANKPPEWKRIEITESMADIILRREIAEGAAYFSRIREVSEVKAILTLWGDDE